MGTSCQHLHSMIKLPFFLSPIEHTNILKIARILHVHLTLFATMPDYIEFMFLRPHMVLFSIKLHWMQIYLVFLPNSRS
jgi:hypothetical protein